MSEGGREVRREERGREGGREGGRGKEKEGERVRESKIKCSPLRQRSVGVLLYLCYIKLVALPSTADTESESSLWSVSKEGLRGCSLVEANAASRSLLRLTNGISLPENKHQKIK